MGLTRRTALVTRAWMLASTLLVAGIPDFHCRCPDGKVKVLCLGLPVQSSGCCCGGNCCSGGNASCCKSSAAPVSEAVAPASCCGQHDPAVTEQAARTSPLHCKGCARSLARTEVLGVTHTKTTAGEDLTAGPLHVPTGDAFLSSSPAGRLLTCWQLYRLPPPTDLIVQLEHFLI
jgi:hypothetical protein